VSFFTEVTQTASWKDVAALPDAVARTLAATSGMEAVAATLRDAQVRRLIVTGNGASYYAAMAAWLASLERPGEPLANVQCIPSGLLASGSFHFRDGDAVLAVSVSGEFRDIVEALEGARLPRPILAVTAGADSTLARQADAVVQIHIDGRATVTHTQDFCNATIACLGILARILRDQNLLRLLESVPELIAKTLDGVEDWLEETIATLGRPTAAVTLAHGTAWAGALEYALLLKEIARIPAEGLETREAATSAMTGLTPNSLVLAIASLGDPHLAEAERLCKTSGATVARVPFGHPIDRRLVPITSFPAGAGLAVALALKAGLDPDNPWWVRTYFDTARAPVGVD
jgi:fructoselysine-6-P-deglycase FrlB-like protein